MKKKATTPVFKSNEIFQKSYPIPWLDNKRLRFDWISWVVQLRNINNWRKSVLNRMDSAYAIRFKFLVVRRVSREDYSFFLPSELYVKLSFHTAQASYNPYVGRQFNCLRNPGLQTINMFFNFMPVDVVQMTFSCMLVSFSLGDSTGKLLSVISVVDTDTFVFVPSRWISYKFIRIII